MAGDLMELFTPPSRTALPKTPGWFDVAYSVCADGNLWRLQASIDVVATLIARSARLEERGRANPFGPLNEVFPPLDVHARITTAAGEAVTKAFAPVSPIPCFARLADGRWILADRRCEIGSDNAQLLSPDGASIRNICLGDGIEHLQCDESGGIWVGYFDEGVFGNFGWGDQGGEPPLGASGLVRFNDRGEISWRFPASSSFESQIHDCYALNVGDGSAWVCAYSEFAIQHVDRSCAVRAWTNQVSGAKALAVDGDRLVLVGGYEWAASRVALLRLGAQAAEGFVELEIDPPFRRTDPASLLVGRNDVVHLVQDGTWMSFSVADVAQTTRRLIAFPRQVD